MHKKTITAWPDTYNSYHTDVLIAAFVAGPKRFREAVGGLNGEALTTRPRPGKWSIKEIVAHVTDSEVQAAFRMRMAWAQPGVVWPVYDQDIWAEEHKYQDLPAADLENLLKLFEALRAVTASLLRNCTEKDWTRKHGVHPEFGPMTLRNLLELYSDHSERHIEQVLTIRQMIGQPLDLPPVLPDRLL